MLTVQLFGIWRQTILTKTIECNRQLLLDESRPSKVDVFKHVCIEHVFSA